MELEKLRICLERTAVLSREALARGDDGFACVLADDAGNILMEQENQAHTLHDPAAHDVILLARRAVKEYSPEFLKQCTVCALVEPCVMCMGALFWSGISRVAYAFSEEQLEEQLPGGLAIHSAEFALRSPKEMCTQGYPELAEAVGACEIVRDWVRTLGIPGLPKE